MAYAEYPSHCAECGNPVTLPFVPTPGKPVYCKKCALGVVAIRRLFMQIGVLIEQKNVLRAGQLLLALAGTLDSFKQKELAKKARVIEKLLSSGNLKESLDTWQDLALKIDRMFKKTSNAQK